MLEMNNSENFSGTSTIQGAVAERYTANLDNKNPEKLSFGKIIVNQQLRKDNREQCRADQAEFEDYVYMVQDQMIETDSVRGDLADEDEND